MANKDSVRKAERDSLEKISEDVRKTIMLVQACHDRCVMVLREQSMYEEVFQYMREAQERLMLAHEYMSRSVLRVSTTRTVDGIMVPGMERM